MDEEVNNDAAAPEMTGAPVEETPVDSAPASENMEQPQEASTKVSWWKKLFGSK